MRQLRRMTRQTEHTALKRALKIPKNKEKMQVKLEMLKEFIKFNLPDWTSSPRAMREFKASLKEAKVIGYPKYFQLDIERVSMDTWTIKPVTGGVKRF